MKITDRTIALALRLFGAIDMLALAAAAMPFAWMQWINARFGYGDLPDAPVVEYLARHVSLWYAVHAATFLFLSTDVPRYRPVIRFLAWLGLAFCGCLLLVNLASGLPLRWAIGEPIGGSIESIVLFALLRATEPTETETTSPLPQERNRG